MAAVPGTSNHGWGLACDVWNVGQNGRLEWLLDNAKRFGFSWEVQSEPWHIRYVLGDDLP
jgi:LAS superfamily LD-carboxypeptidase LdcB